MRINNLIHVIFILVSFECHSQMELDTTRVLADGINKSRGSLGKVVMKIAGEENDVIFVKVDNFKSTPTYKKAYKYDSIVVLFTRELELFHFGIGEFIEINEINIEHDSMKVAFSSKHHFNKLGPYVGYMIFVKKEENWPIDSLVIK